MELTTRIFGTIDIDEEKIITFENGIIGFGDLKRFILIHDAENENASITWLQSIDEPAFAMPVIDPLLVNETYDPIIEDELLMCLGELSAEDILVLVTVTVPSDITKMTCNLMAPIIINANNRKACQVITEGDEYPVKYEIYDILKARKEQV
ncbi:MAG: flagellar assembly protein FliW [Lachnospiraceae bacterium]|nr:flagellar assembly protein FliW [Lachnospiraceae bacterium]